MAVLVGGVYCVMSLVALAQMGGGWFLLGIVFPPLNVATPVLYRMVTGEWHGFLTALFIVSLIAIYNELEGETA